MIGWIALLAALFGLIAVLVPAFLPPMVAVIVMMVILFGIAVVTLSGRVPAP